LIAEMVTQTVVHDFEAIQVEEHFYQLLPGVAVPLPFSTTKPLEQITAIRQTG
jgi:hypothetical protein